MEVLNELWTCTCFSVYNVHVHVHVHTCTCISAETINKCMFIGRFCLYNIFRQKVCLHSKVLIDILHLVELFSFSFARVMPGKYNLKASHASWSFETVSTKEALECILNSC